MTAGSGAHPDRARHCGHGITGNKGDVLGTATLYSLLFLMLMAARAEAAARTRTRPSTR